MSFSLCLVKPQVANAGIKGPVQNHVELPEPCVHRVKVEAILENKKLDFATITIISSK